MGYGQGSRGRGRRAEGLNGGVDGAGAREGGRSATPFVTTRYVYPDERRGHSHLRSV